MMGTEHNSLHTQFKTFVFLAHNIKPGFCTTKQNKDHSGSKLSCLRVFVASEMTHWWTHFTDVVCNRRLYKEQDHDCLTLAVGFAQQNSF